MLHNTGTFDQNDVPIKQNNLSSEDRIISSNNIMSKSDQSGQIHFSVPYQVNLGLTPYNHGFEVSAQRFQNNGLPLNLNVQNNSVLTKNYPQVFTKAYHKQMDIDYNYLNSYKQPNYDVNHVNTPGMALSLRKHNEDTKTSDIKPQSDILTKISQESSYKIEVDLSRKPVNNVNTDSITDLSNKLLRDDSRKRLANTVKIIENIISHPSNSRKIKLEHNIKTENYEDLSETSDTDFVISESDYNDADDKRGMSKSYKPGINSLDTLCSTVKTENWLCDDDKASNKDIQETSTRTVVVPSILNIEQINPFLKDTHGVQSDETKNYDIIGAESSINVAKEIIKKGASLIATYFECPHCKLFFNNPKRFIIHTKWHTFGYITEKKLRSQKEKIVKPRSRKYKVSGSDDNTEEGIIPCTDCKRTFSSTPSLMNHRRKYHPTRLRECKICGKTMVGLAALRAHVTTHTTESRFQCEDCPKWFKYAHSLAKHRDTHLEKTEECPQCPKKFGSTALLNVHMKTHERVLRGATFRCTYCGKGFFESYSLQAHERTHRNERPFVCEICNTSFGTNSSLKRHLKVSHSTSKPFECTTCHRSFVSENIRDRHFIRYHGDPEEFKFMCKLCPCKYLNARELRRHIYKVHPKPKIKVEVGSD
ncbi:zinc finger protein 16-like [Danaus plexippus]|uniref:zinc finger protein 16-like n=1 Tax=Danaus plexippus TaxID=13037 RepID=UPI002AB021BE|nr:zinc finger protein 16-like [Danaus plexippus]